MMDSQIQRLIDLINQVREGYVNSEIQEQIRPIIHELKQNKRLEDTQNILISKGFSEYEAKILTGDHPYYIRWKYLLPTWHPIFILKIEHIHFMKIGSDSVRRMYDVIDSESIEQASEFIEKIIDLFKSWKTLSSHMVREENVLFPFLERYGYDSLTTQKWDEHDEIRLAQERLEGFLNRLKQEKMDLSAVKKGLRELVVALNKAAGNHYSYEERDLFNKALDVFSRQDWIKIRRDFDELGYIKDIEVAKVPQDLTIMNRVVFPKPQEGEIQLNGMWIGIKELEAVLNVLPVDITFVDKNDQVRFFNEVPDRVFPRAKSVIGREVRRCHPKKSLHLVNKILEDFKQNKRDVAEFWINYRGRFLYIRYFAVRDKNGDYLGTLEVTQDVTRIRELKGEKRLLDDA